MIDLPARRVHINYTVSSHQDGNFLAWHRNFVYLWETALREECEYRGYQPYVKPDSLISCSTLIRSSYWDWPSNYLDLAGSPHFDGSDTSLSGDGAADDNYKLDFDFPKGTGGGCVLSGPFKNITVSMGPFPGLRNDRLPANAFAYQPSCLKRDLNSPLSGLCNGPDVTAALLNAENITEFQEIMHNGVGVNALLGPHGCGHLSIGPMMTDLWSSTSDPAFMLHHANVDRLWALWQEKDLRTRRFALNGTIMISDPPGAPKTTLQTVLGWGGLDRPRKVREVMDPKKYCYRYE